MKQYQQTEDGVTIDGMHIPVAPGNRHYQQMTKEVADGDAEILPYIPPVKTVDAVRQESYQEAGITTSKMVVAMWEKVVEGRPDSETGIDVMQAARTLIKTNNPKV